MRLPVDLAPGTRRRLVEAGFDLREWNDPQLKSVEYTASAVASGAHVFVPSELAPMVEVLVETSTQDRRAR